MAISVLGCPTQRAHGQIGAGAPPVPPPAPAAPASPPPALPAGGAAAGTPNEPTLTRPVERPVVVDALQPYESRLIRAVTISGLKRTDQQLVRNQIRSAEGRPLSIETATGDVRRLTRLGRFREINAKVQPYADGSVELIYQLVETPLIANVQAVGNRQLSDQELGTEINMLAGTPVDRFQLDRALRRIKELYKKKGYYQADVAIDEKELEESGIVLFRVREGDRLRITDIRFSGNANLEPKRIRRVIKSESWGLLDSGAIDDVTVDQDLAAIADLYKNRGFLDVRVDREIRPSPDGREAILTFIIEEGPVYLLRSVVLDTDDGRGQPAKIPPEVISQVQAAGLLAIKTGDVYAQDKVRKSSDALAEAYGKLGYSDARVTRLEKRDVSSPVVDLILLVSEGRRFSTGMVLIKGNDLTQQKVIRREIGLYPDRPLDSSGVKATELRLRDRNIFEQSSIRVTPQPEDPSMPGQRDVLVEVKETNTGSLTFGAAISSDSGVLGSVSLSQRNFDLYDTPDTVDEFIRGRALRGAGQEFSITLQPGNEVQNYIISLSEPALFESNYSGSISGGYRVREFDDYTENRLGGSGSIGRRFGRVWSGAVTLRGDLIDIRDVDRFSIVDLRAVEGDSAIAGLGLRMRRNALDQQIRPTAGTRLDLAGERLGPLGDYEFTKLFASGTAFFTVDEDALARKTVLKLRNSMGFIPEGNAEAKGKSGAPVFERLYLGGRDFRGFRFRGVSPRGRVDPDGPGGNPSTVSNDPSGGSWSFFLGAEIEKPLFSELVGGVLFIDSGTVTATDNPTLDDYRVSVGAGIRVYIPQLGPAPLAFDFGFPIVREDGDQKRLFSFTLDIPF